MNQTRRQLLTYGSLLGASSLLPFNVFAQTQQLFSDINMFIPAGPGGGWDTTGRSIEIASKEAGLVGSFKFENVGGAGGMVGLPKFINQYKGKGNAVMVGGSVMVGAALTNKSPFSMKDVVPVARLTEEAGILVVPAGGKIKTWQDFVTAIKADPKAVSVGGGSAGGTDHQVLGLLIKALGANPRDAAYVAFAGGGPAVAALLGNQVSAGISGYSEFEEHIKSGKLIALAISGEKRTPGVDVPTFKELGVDVTLTNWRAVFAPPKIGDADLAKLVEYFTQLNASKPWQTILEQRKWNNVFLAGDGFKEALAKDITATEVILKELGLA